MVQHRHSSDVLKAALHWPDLRQLPTIDVPNHNKLLRRIISAHVLRSGVEQAVAAHLAAAHQVAAAAATVATAITMEAAAAVPLAAALPAAHHHSQVCSQSHVCLLQTWGLAPLPLIGP